MSHMQIVYGNLAQWGHLTACVLVCVLRCQHTVEVKICSHHCMRKNSVSTIYFGVKTRLRLGLGL